MSGPTIEGVCPKCQAPYTQHAYESFACACGWSAVEAAASEATAPVKVGEPQPDSKADGPKGDSDAKPEDKP